MRIVRIDGGLGNQMFCYAFALALQKASGEEVLIDSHRYKFFPNHHGYELSRVFGIKAQEATPTQLWKVTWPAYNVLVSRLFQYLPHRSSEIVENFEKCCPNILKEHPCGYYIGNWQWYKYFHHLRPILLKTFKFSEPLGKQNRALFNKLQNDNNSVSIHVRRGDYLNTPLYSGICDLEFYKRAIVEAKKQIKNKARFVIFSNDTQWCKNYLLPELLDSSVIIVDWNTGTESYRDMQLMSVCRGNIVANSSFSWWGAYLNDRSDKFVIAPTTWINCSLNYRIQCDEWICL